MVCRTELRSLKNIYPQYQEKLTVLLVAYDLSESIERLHSIRAKEKYPWEIAIAGETTLTDYNVLAQSTKIIVDRNGMIVNRSGYGQWSTKMWHQILGQVIQ